MKFISIVDDTGRTSSLLVRDDGLQVIGVLPHGCTIKPKTDADARALVRYFQSFTTDDRP